MDRRKRTFKFEVKSRGEYLVRVLRDDDDTKAETIHFLISDDLRSVYRCKRVYSRQTKMTLLMTKTTVLMNPDNTFTVIIRNSELINGVVKHTDRLLKFDEENMLNNKCSCNCNKLIDELKDPVFLRNDILADLEEMLDLQYVDN